VKVTTAQARAVLAAPRGRVRWLDHTSQRCEAWLLTFAHKAASRQADLTLLPCTTLLPL